MRNDVANADERMMLVVVAVHSHVRLDDYVPSLRRVLHWPRTAVVAIPCCVDQSMEVAEAGEQSEGGRLDDEAVGAGWGKKQRASTNKKRKRLVVPSKEFHDYGVFSIQRIVRVFDLPEGAGTGLGGDRSRPGRSTKGDSTAREGTSKQGQPQPSVESVGGIGQDTSRGQRLQRHGQQQQQQSAIEVGDRDLSEGDSPPKRNKNNANVASSLVPSSSSDSVGRRLGQIARLLEESGDV